MASFHSSLLSAKNKGSAEASSTERALCEHLAKFVLREFYREFQRALALLNLPLMPENTNSQPRLYLEVFQVNLQNHDSQFAQYAYIHLHYNYCTKLCISNINLPFPKMLLCDGATSVIQMRWRHSLFDGTGGVVEFELKIFPASALPSKNFNTGDLTSC